MNIPHWYLLEYLTQYEGDYPRASSDVYKIVSAIKGRLFNGYVTVTIGGRTRQFREAQSEDLRNIFLGLAGQVGLPKVITQNVSIIPIPNSNMTGTSGDDHRIIKSTNAMLQAYQAATPRPAYDVTVDPVLRWREPKEPSHENGGGGRDPNAHLRNLSLVGEIDKPVILFDDVYTSGSQTKASAHVLSQSGCEVIAIVTMAKTVHEPSEDTVKWRQGETCVIRDALFGGIY